MRSTIIRESADKQAQRTSEISDARCLVILDLMMSHSFPYYQETISLFVVLQPFDILIIRNGNMQEIQNQKWLKPLHCFNPEIRFPLLLGHEDVFS